MEPRSLVVTCHNPSCLWIRRIKKCYQFFWKGILTGQKNIVTRQVNVLRTRVLRFVHMHIYIIYTYIHV